MFEGHLQHEPPAPVVFRVPASQRFVHWVMRGFALLMVPGVLALVLWVLIASVFWPTGAIPAWFHVMGAAVVALSAVAMTVAGSRSLPSRLVLATDGLLIGGVLGKRRFAYEDVRLVELVKPERTLNRMLRVVIRPHRGHAASIWLARDDAEECFHALRGLCDSAAAIGVENEAYRPVSSEHEMAGRSALAREYRRKAILSGIGAFIVLLVAIGAIIALVVSPSVRSHPRAWMFALVFPFVAVALARRSMLLARQARDVLHVPGFGRGPETPSAE